MVTSYLVTGVLFAHSKDVSLQSQIAPAKVFLRTGCASTAFGFSQPFTSTVIGIFVCLYLLQCRISIARS